MRRVQDRRRNRGVLYRVDVHRTTLPLVSVVQYRSNNHCISYSKQREIDDLQLSYNYAGLILNDSKSVYLSHIQHYIDLICSSLALLLYLDNQNNIGICGTRTTNVKNQKNKGLGLCHTPASKHSKNQIFSANKSNLN